MNDALYREYLIDLYAKKKNFGELEGKTHEVSHSHLGCDDNIVIQLRVERGVVADAKFKGKTCFISTVASEVLMDKIKGMKVEDVKNLKKEDVDKLLGVDIIPTRVGCEVFPLDALRKLEI